MSGLGVRRGALSFKGEKKTKKPRAIRQFSDDDESGSRVSLKSGPSMKEGEGRVVCYGTTLQGMETRFKEEIDVGDTIIVRHPQSLKLEERIVVSILSQRSLTFDSPFSSDFVSTTEYCIRKDSESLKSKNGIKQEEGIPSEAAEEAFQRELKARIEKEKKTLTYQEKVGMWGYRSVTEKVNGDLSKEDLLEMRSRKVHDKYC